MRGYKTIPYRGTIAVHVGLDSKTHAWINGIAIPPEWFDGHANGSTRAHLRVVIEDPRSTCDEVWC